MKDTVIMSINPKYVKMIFSLNPTKKWELRRRIWSSVQNGKHMEMSHALVYETGTGTIVGQFDIGNVYRSAADGIWGIVCRSSGVTFEELITYFHGCRNCFAIEILNPMLFVHPIPLSEFGVKRAPQSWMYLPEVKE